MRDRQGKPIKYVQRLCVVFALCTAMPISSHAQTVIHRFTTGNGATPWAPPVEGFDTYLYGTTELGGMNNSGTVYKLTPEGKQAWVYSFCAILSCPDGSSPLAGIVPSSDGLLYGTTWLGGANSVGTAFSIRPNGTHQFTLHSFCQLTNCTDGSQPRNTMVAAADGYKYGTALQGGAGGGGVIFNTDIVNNGQTNILYAFCSAPNCADGEYPIGPLIHASDGNLYGTTEIGGAYQFGTVFQFDPVTLKLTTIYNFCQLTGCPDGGQPSSGVIEGADGNFYGVALHGVTSTGGVGQGVVFQLTPQGVLNVLHTFTGADGHGPVGLIQATDGNLYGMTELGGAHNRGTIFEVTIGGTFTKLYDFYGYGKPYGGLMQKTDGNLYGATSVGGTTSSVVSHGVLFRYDTGLSPFVKLMTTFGAVGSVVGIYGPNLTGATSITFNGVPASPVDVTSSTTIYTDVPAGATTGPVVVTTPSGMLTSNVSFTVIP